MMTSSHLRTIATRAVLLALLGAGGFGTLSPMPPAHAQIPQTRRTAPPPITTKSSPAAIALARHLRQINAQMYGAYWCPHCHEQQALFGAAAFKLIPYVECAEDGVNAKPQLCQSAGIKGYPTWKIRGKLYPGTRSLEELANLSGYRGSRKF